MMKVLIVMISSLVMSACTQLGFTVANAPVWFSKDFKKTEIVFDDEHHLSLDIYQPNAPHDTAQPTLLFFYGGRWTDGDKSQYQFVADRFIREGYTVVIPNYRKYPDVKFPAFVEDTAKAIAWTYNNIKDFNGRQDLIFVAGHSAGAHIGLLALADKRYLQKYNLVPANIRGFVGLSGPYAFTPDAADLRDMFGPPENYPQMQAQSFIDGSEPPLFLLHGGEDSLVGFFNAETVRDVSLSHGGNVTVKLYPELGHAGTVSALTWIYRDKNTVDTDILRFFDQLQK